MHLTSCILHLASYILKSCILHLASCIYAPLGGRPDRAGECDARGLLEHRGRAWAAALARAREHSETPAQQQRLAPVLPNGGGGALARAARAHGARPLRRRSVHRVCRRRARCVVARSARWATVQVGVQVERVRRPQSARESPLLPALHYQTPQQAAGCCMFTIACLHMQP